MQIHELTAKQHLDEGVLDTIKVAAGNAVDKGLSAFAGATKGFGTGAIPQTGGVAADPSAQPFTGQTLAQMKTKKAQPNPAALKKFGNLVIDTWNSQSAQLEQKKGRPLTDAEYKLELGNFISQAFFKGQKGLLGVVEKQTINRGIDAITKVRDDPGMVEREFTQLIEPFLRYEPDYIQALQPWKGKKLVVNLNHRGMVRAAEFTWTGQYWQDVASGRPVDDDETAKDLTRSALGLAR